MPPLQGHWEERVGTQFGNGLIKSPCGQLRVVLGHGALADKGLLTRQTPQAPGGTQSDGEALTAVTQTHACTHMCTRTYTCVHAHTGVCVHTHAHAYTQGSLGRGQTWGKWVARRRGIWKELNVQ